MDAVQQKAKQNHIDRLAQYPYLWRFKYQNGIVRVFGSESDRPPVQTAGRVGSQSGYGSFVSSNKLTKYEAEAHIRELREDFERQKKADRIAKKIQILDERPWIEDPPDQEDEDHTVTPVLLPGSDMRIDPEISKNDIPIEDLLSDEEADEELLGHVVALQTALSKMEKFTKGADRILNLAADADDDEEYADMIAGYARSLRKKFGEVVNDVDCAFEAIIENLEGA